MASRRPGIPETKTWVFLAAGFLAMFASVLVHSESISELKPAADIRLQPLNPARGDASPKAGVLWGDLRRDVPSGAIIEFVEGFASPPHIHNITYRGVVIEGAIHNDDPDAGKLWLGPGSFWTQPAGEVHITAAATTSRIFLEILSGPYLVQAPEEAFDSGERPVNVDASNLVWLGSSDTSWIEEQADSTPGETALAFLWGAPEDGTRNGTMLRLPAGFTGELRGEGGWLRAVVIRGLVEHHQSPGSAPGRLPKGSYLGIEGTAPLGLSCTSADGCLVYVSSEGRYRLVVSPGAR